jgi:hypothetical protein
LLSLSSDERELLQRLLEGALGDARMEMHHTRTTDYRDIVRQGRELMRDLLEKLRAPEAAEV